MLVAVILADWPAHSVGGLDKEKVGVANTVIVNVPVQPVEDVEVIIAVPGETAVATPLAFTETFALLLLQALPEAGG